MTTGLHLLDGFQESDSAECVHGTSGNVSGESVLCHLWVLRDATLNTPRNSRCDARCFEVAGHDATERDATRRGATRYDDMRPETALTPFDLSRRHLT